jgi:hypothetical protein
MAIYAHRLARARARVWAAHTEGADEVVRRKVNKPEQMLWLEL